jgi:hypothetical protein
LDREVTLALTTSSWPGNSRSKNGVASLAYVPAISIAVYRRARPVGMPGTRPGMTVLNLPRLPRDQ